jgi:site-specific recombinase XerD
MKLLPKNVHVLRFMHERPLGPYLDSYAAEMHQQGYAAATVRAHLGLLTDFSRWLAVHRLSVHEITAELFPCYLRSRQRRHWRITHNNPSALKRMFDLLIRQGVIAEPAHPLRSPVDQVLDEFASYLRQERGLAELTVKLHLFFIGKFLAERFGTWPVDLSTLTGSDVIDFVRRRVRSMKPEYAKSQNSALRVFLQFERYRGHLSTDLAACVPSVPIRDLSTLPKAIPGDQIQLLLASCDRTTSVGRRTYAILLLLARLGLRATELLHLRLEDLDLQNGWITVRGKRGRFSQLPLPVDVGEAVVDYLRNARPKSDSRYVFLRANAPISGFKGSTSLGGIVREAVLRAGINSPQKGTHQFRHALATQMLQRGASLPEIAELLRHRSFRTTAIYAKVDVAALRTLALPWPGRAYQSFRTRASQTKVDLSTLRTLALPWPGRA